MNNKHTQVQPEQLTHGGQLNIIAKRYNIPKDHWVDCSTGISPFSYPLPEVPLSVWQNLPQTEAALLDAAKKYYQSKHCFACNGSQSIIEKLPSFWSTKHISANTVYLPTIGYKEHQKAWQLAGYTLQFYQESLPKKLNENSVVVIINPNNPSGQLFSKETLLSFHQQAKATNSLLILDEAFMDVVSPSQSLAPYIDDDSLLILKSFGKFFGLAGLRIGFVCCSQHWQSYFSRYFSPWHINGPAQFIAEQALVNTAWQVENQAQLIVQSNKLTQLLLQKLNPVYKHRCQNSHLFVTVYLEQAENVHHQLCTYGIYTRLTDEKNSLRFGILTNEHLDKLAEVLPLISPQIA